VAIEASAQGHIRRLWAPEGWSGTSLGLLRNILVAAQFVWPEDGSPSDWQVEQQDDQGTAGVAYERKGDSVRRARQRDLPPEAPDGPGEESVAPSVEPEGELTAVVDGQRRLVRLEGTEATNLLLEKKTVVRSEMAVKFERLRAETVSRGRIAEMK